MKIEFTFNDTTRLTLIPENGKDKQLLQLYAGGMNTFRSIAPPANEEGKLIIEATAVPLHQKCEPVAASSRLEESLKHQSPAKTTISPSEEVEILKRLTEF